MTQTGKVMRRIKVIDSHTGGEPTRIVISGGPELGSGTAAERLAVFRRSHDLFRSAVVNEPRGSDVVVGGLIVEPVNPACAAGVIFFNNVGYLGMCGHGLIGLMRTLEFLGRVQTGTHRIETPVGEVEATLHPNGDVTVKNVPSYRLAESVAVEVPGLGVVHGDIAWGGNWFFLVEDHGQVISLSSVEKLTDVSWRIRQELVAQGITGANGAEIDHIELFGPAQDAGGDSRNFVLCPGKAYDRSPCGTGTSAKLACLAASGKLDEGQTWVQESVLGSRFLGSYQWIDREKGVVQPIITGNAFVCAESTLILDEADPFTWGIR